MRLGREKIAFFTVNYKNTLYTRNFVESLSRLKHFEKIKIIILDNASTSDTISELERIKKMYHNIVECFYLDENLYYWRGADYALRRVYPLTEYMPEWIIICNNDIIINQENFLEKLMSLNYKEYGILAPSIKSYETNKDQNPFLVFPLNIMDIIKRKILLSNWYVYRLIVVIRENIKNVKFKLLGFNKNIMYYGNDFMKIYAPHGSFVIFSRNFFEKGGYLDTNFDLYGEELTIAEVALRIGVSVVYVPILEVIHLEHRSLGKYMSKNNFYKAKKAFEYVCREYLNKKVIL
uniref:Glycosyltransferase n=1 Tax=Dictyoglomus thermophilum TaxID=14 RepID=A0A7C3MIT7_DICTH